MEPTSVEQPKNKKIYYYIVGALIILGGALFFLNNMSTSKISERESNPVVNVMPLVKPATYTVTYSDAGYNPATLEVPAGTIVRFMNNSNDEMWVASAMHPSHTQLPGFDQLKPGQKNTSYDYAFTKAGTWKYHDHLKPEFRGSITVK